MIIIDLIKVYYNPAPQNTMYREVCNFMRRMKIIQETGCWKISILAALRSLAADRGALVEQYFKEPNTDVSTVNIPMCQYDNMISIICFSLIIACK